jgi:hypothetical protein
MVGRGRGAARARPGGGAARGAPGRAGEPPSDEGDEGDEGMATTADAPGALAPHAEAAIAVATTDVPSQLTSSPARISPFDGARAPRFTPP